MDNTVLVALISLIGGGIVTQAVNAYFTRRKDTVAARKSAAETEAIESKTRREEVDYYRGRVEESIKQMSVLEAEVRELKTYIKDIQDKYEQRVSELHGKIDRLSTELDRANDTIAQLRQEVKDGNAIIVGLKDEITKLLIDKAEKQQGD